MRAVPEWAYSRRSTPGVQPVAHRVTSGEWYEDDERLSALWLCRTADSAIEAVPAAQSTQLCRRCLYAWRAGAVRGPAVYRALDADGQVIYVGATGNLALRVLAHRASTHWWPAVVRIEHDPYPTRGEAFLAEPLEIAKHNPRWNRLGRTAA